MSEKATINIFIFKRLVSFARPYKSLFLFAVLCTVTLAVLGSFRPYIIGDMVSKYVIKSKDGDKLIFWTIVVVGMLVMEGILQFSSSYLSNLLAQSVIKDIREKLFGHVLSFRMRYFDSTPVGALVTRVVSDLEAVTEVFSSGLIDIAGDLISLVFVISLMFFVDWELSLMTILPIPLLIFATRIFARAMRNSFQLERQQVTRLNTFVQERITGISIVQLFNRQKQEYKNFEEINKGHRQAHVNAVWANSIFFPIVEMLSSMSIALMLVWGAVYASGKTADQVEGMYAQIISFTLWVNMLFRPIRQLADKFNILQRGTVRAERVFEIIDLNDHIQNPGTVTSCDFNQTIHFKNIHFAYKDENWVLKNISLDIEAGSTVAFVGATGAGKSTIVNLLGRFYDYQKGEIFIGDSNIRDIELSYLRTNIAIVLQDVFLFSDTIHNNITLGDNSISREQVIAAAKEVGADVFIQKLPGGYDYQVGERGGVFAVPLLV
jgi:ATP-binding cassette subfamily B protein